MACYHLICYFHFNQSKIVHKDKRIQFKPPYSHEIKAPMLAEHPFTKVISSTEQQHHPL